MCADHSAGALAIDVQVADVKLLHAALEFLLVPAIDGARQTELGVVGNPQRMIEAVRLDDRQDGPEDLFLLQLGLLRNVRKDSGLDEEAIAAFDALAAGD